MLSSIQRSKLQKRAEQKRLARARYRQKNAAVINKTKRQKRAENAEYMRNYRNRINTAHNEMDDKVLPQLPTDIVDHILDYADDGDEQKVSKQAVNEKYWNSHASHISATRSYKREKNVTIAREATAERMRKSRKRRRDESELIIQVADHECECRDESEHVDRSDATTNTQDEDFSYFTDYTYESTSPLDANTPVTYLSDNVNDDALDELSKSLRETRREEEDIDEDGKKCYHANVCVICDCIILDTKRMERIDKDDLISKKDKLSTQNYMEHFGEESLNEILVSQYRVNDPDLNDLLLSPRSRYNATKGGYECCVSCYTSLRSNVQSCPKYSIANGFAIGHLPSWLHYKDSSNEDVSVRFDPEKDLSDLLCAAISPVRPFGYVHAYSGGCQKKIKGHFSLFSVDQTHVGGVFNKFRDEGGSKNIYVVLCGRMTPAQKSLIKRKAVLDTSMFLSLLTWYIKSSGHRGYEDVIPPDECPDPVAYIEDEDNDNNTDESENPHVENQMGHNTYYFSSDSQNPQPNTSVYNRSQDFIHEMLDNAGDPTMLMYGGSYLKSHEIRLEDAFPIQFPFGLGGPDMGVDRRVKVSTESCLRHYMRLSLNQFMRADFILVCYQMLCRSASFTTGLIKCRSDFQGVQLGEKLSNLSIDDIKRASTRLSSLQSDNQTIHSHTDAESFLKSVTSSCKSIGHTAEAAKDARKKCYAMADRFGPHSLFFTITPDDENSFRVRMFANQGNQIYVPGVDCSDAECVADFSIRSRMRIKYPGACSLYYQSAIQEVYKMLGWDARSNKAKECGIFGQVEAFCRADEEQGRGTLHGHFLIWIKNFNKIWLNFFSSNEDLRNSSREILRRYIDKVFCADYKFQPSLPVIHESCESHESCPLSEIFEERDIQTYRDCRSKSLSPFLGGKVVKCKACGNGPNGETSFKSTDDVSKSFLKSKLLQHGAGDITIPVDALETYLSPERIDLLTSRYPIDCDDCTADGSFIFNSDVRHFIASRRMNEHDWRHRPSCFKYGGECRYCFPYMCEDSTCVKVDESDESLGTTWRYVDGTSKTVFPFSVKPKRGMGSQFLNTHISRVTKNLACNSNIQIGSPRCVFYVVHYTTKNTQNEDKGPDFERIGRQVMARIQREKEKKDQELQDILLCSSNQDMSEESRSSDDSKKESFREGLCRFLLGMSIHLSQDVVSATMAHLLLSQEGTRFSFSHTFKDLLLGQMLNRLSGKNPGDFVLRRRMKNETDADMWPDFSVNDYLFRHDCLRHISFYEFTSRFEKAILSSERMMKLDERGFPKIHKNELALKEGHPGRRYCVVRKCSQERIPKISMPHGMLSNLEELELLEEDRETPDQVSDTALYKRENYAKIALLLFHPFSDDDVFSLDDDDCLWDKFQRLMSEGKKRKMK